MHVVGDFYQVDHILFAIVNSKPAIKMADLLCYFVNHLFKFCAFKITQIYLPEQNLMDL